MTYEELKALELSAEQKKQAERIYLASLRINKGKTNPFENYTAENAADNLNKALVAYGKRKAREAKKAEAMQPVKWKERHTALKNALESVYTDCKFTTDEILSLDASICDLINEELDKKIEQLEDTIEELQAKRIK